MNLPYQSSSSISAITLATHDMGRAIEFYGALGFTVEYGGPDAPFSTLRARSACINLVAQPADVRWSWWGRIVFHVPDVDTMYARVCQQQLTPENEPVDASWGERYFHISDPDGHQLSFASPLKPQ